MTRPTITLRGAEILFNGRTTGAAPPWPVELVARIALQRRDNFVGEAGALIVDCTRFARSPKSKLRFTGRFVYFDFTRNVEQRASSLVLPAPNLLRFGVLSSGTEAVLLTVYYHWDGFPTFDISETL